MLLPGAVAALAAELAADPAAAAAYPGYREIDAAGRIEDTVVPIGTRHDRPCASRHGHRPRRARAALGAGAGRRLGSALRWMGDLIMWMGVGLAGSVIRVADPLACWRRHPGSATLQPSAEHAREHLRMSSSAPGSTAWAR